jgi:hypothetical protein
MSDFITYPPEQVKKCKIWKFDDGNQYLEKGYLNEWFLVGTNNQGKVKLINCEDPQVIVSSISEWKIHITN